MRIQAVETRVYEYEPDLDDGFYEERNVKTIEGCLQADKAFFDEHGTKEMTDLDDSPQITVVWKLLNDDGSVIATF